MKFLLIMVQDNGCDYTIRCGLDIKEIQASSYEDAIAEAFKVMAYDWNDSPRIDDDIDRASLYEIKVPLAEYRQQLATQERALAESDARISELGLFQKLKEKYEGK